LNTDAHEPKDLITRENAEKVLVGARIPKERFDEILERNPKHLLKRISK
jgi:histidinol phosphatase-like PHP family hydrolase